MFFERAPLAETISEPKGKKTILFFLWFWYLLSTTSMIYEGSKAKTCWVTFFFASIPLRGLISKIPIHIRVFWTCTPGRNHFRPQGQKNYLILSLILVLLSTTSMVFEGSRVQTFGPPFFYRYTLAGSNIKNSIHIRVFWTCTPGRNHFRPQGQKNYLILSLILVFVFRHQYGLWRLKSDFFLGHLFFYRYTLAGSNTKNSIHIRVFWTCTPGRNHFRPQTQKTYLFFSLILVFVVHHPHTCFLNVHPWQKQFQTPRAKNYLIVSLILVFFLLSCPQSVLFREGLRIDFFGSIFFPCVPLRGFIHLNMSMHNGVFSTCIPGKNHFKKLTKIQNHKLQILNPKSKNLRSQIPKSKMWCMSTYILLYWFILCYVCLQKSNFRGNRGKPF